MALPHGIFPYDTLLENPSEKVVRQEIARIGSELAKKYGERRTPNPSALLSVRDGLRFNEMMATGNLGPAQHISPGANYNGDGHFLDQPSVKRIGQNAYMLFHRPQSALLSNPNRRIRPFIGAGWGDIGGRKLFRVFGNGNFNTRFHSGGGGYPVQVNEPLPYFRQNQYNNGLSDDGLSDEDYSAYPLLYHRLMAAHNLAKKHGSDVYKRFFPQRVPRFGNSARDIGNFLNATGSIKDHMDNLNVMSDALEEEGLPVANFVRQMIRPRIQFSLLTLQ